SLTSATQLQSGAVDQSDQHGAVGTLLDLAARTIVAQTDDGKAEAGAREALQASRHGVVSIKANGCMVIHNRVALDILNLSGCPLYQPLKAMETAPQIAGLRILRSKENQDVELL